MFNSIQQRYIDPYLFESFKDFRVVIDFPLFGHGMRKWKCWRRISLIFTMFRFNLFLTLRDWLVIFLTRFKNRFSITLPLRRVMTDLAWSMCWFPELLAFALYCPLGFYCGWDGNLPFSWKLRADVNFARVSLKSVMLWVSWVLIVSCFSTNACNVSSRFLLGGGAY